MEKEPPTELDLPDGVHAAEQAIEVLRAWIADGALLVTFDPMTFHNGPADWGRLLADVAHHVSNAMALAGEGSRDETLAAIKTAFAEHVEAPSQHMSGSLRGQAKH